SLAVLTVNGVDQAAGRARTQLGALAGQDARRFDRETGLSKAISQLTGSLGVEVAPGTAAPFPGGAALIGVKQAAPVRSFLDRVATYAAEALSAKDPGSRLALTH